MHIRATNCSITFSLFVIVKHDNLLFMFLKLYYGFWHLIRDDIPEESRLIDSSNVLFITLLVFDNSRLLFWLSTHEYLLRYIPRWNFDNNVILKKPLLIILKHKVALLNLHSFSHFRANVLNLIFHLYDSFIHFLNPIGHHIKNEDNFMLILYVSIVLLELVLWDASVASLQELDAGHSFILVLENLRVVVGYHHGWHQRFWQTWRHTFDHICLTATILRIVALVKLLLGALDWFDALHLDTAVFAENLHILRIQVELIIGASLTKEGLLVVDGTHRGANMEQSLMLMLLVNV